MAQTSAEASLGAVRVEYNEPQGGKDEKARDSIHECDNRAELPDEELGSLKIYDPRGTYRMGVILRHQVFL